MEYNRPKSRTSYKLNPSIREQGEFDNKWQIYVNIYDLWFLLKKGTRFELNLVNDKLKYYKKVFEKDVFMERIKRTGVYWEPELKPLVIGRLPRFELVYNDVKAVLNDLI